MVWVIAFGELFFGDLWCVVWGYGGMRTHFSLLNPLLAFSDAFTKELGTFAVAVTVSFQHFQYSFVAGDFSLEDTSDVLFVLGCHGISGHGHGGADSGYFLIFGAIVGGHVVFLLICCAVVYGGQLLGLLWWV